jgi:hypothetical protein
MKQDYWDQIFWEAARKDADYQTLLQRCREAEADYRRILDTLSPEQQEQLETYISLCEELQYRMTQLALQVPRQ